jgi:cysteine desulfurase
MIYFDNAATTEDLYSFDEKMNTPFGNPSSAHGLGIASERLIKKSSSIIAEILACRPEEIVYTSGGTESNNLAILGTAYKYIKKGGGIIASPFEHPSTSQPLRYLKEQGFNVVVADPSEWEGLICRDDEKKIFLACLTHVDSETGGVNNIASVSSMIKKANPSITVHVDGAQGFCKETADLSDVDLYSFSSHKIHGSAGTGGLMVRKGTRLVPLMYGGGQQNGVRPGTENVAGVRSFGHAADSYFTGLNETREKMNEINTIISSLEDEIPGVCANTRGVRQSPFILNMSFFGVKGETLVRVLSEQEIYISAGAACRSSKKASSPLLDMGFGEERAESAVRFSFSRLNTVEEAETAKEAVRQTVNQLRLIHAKRK